MGTQMMEQDGQVRGRKKKVAEKEKRKRDAAGKGVSLRSLHRAEHERGDQLIR